jgi:hypothetical protein
MLRGPGVHEGQSGQIAAAMANAYVDRLLEGAAQLDTKQLDTN